MLILLPPSEGKTPAAGGDAVDWTALSFPALNVHRAMVLESLGTVSAHEDALALLGVGASLSADVARNTRLHAEPAAPAHQVYSGVLYDALGYDSLTPAQRSRADACVAGRLRALGGDPLRGPGAGVPAVDGNGPARRRPARRLLETEAE